MPIAMMMTSTMQSPYDANNNDDDDEEDKEKEEK